MWPANARRELVELGIRDEGLEAVPAQWIQSLISCRPEAERPNVRHPRPACYWPVDALDLAEQLLSIAPGS